MDGCASAAGVQGWSGRINQDDIVTHAIVGCRKADDTALA